MITLQSMEQEVTIDMQQVYAEHRQGVIERHAHSVRLLWEHVLKHREHINLEHVNELLVLGDKIKELERLRDLVASAHDSAWHEARLKHEGLELEVVRKTSIIASKVSLDLEDA